MVEVIFIFNQIQTVIQANMNDSFDKIINQFKNKTNLDLNDLYFLSNGKNINKNEKINNVMNDSDKINKKMTILVYSNNSNANRDNTYNIKSNDVICPICKELCKYEINNHKIKLYDCKNGHTTDNIKFNEFNIKQNIDISQIKCDKCKNKSKSDTFNNEFFICNECNMNLCPLCKSVHDKSHSIINYDNKNYICNKHDDTFIKYCEDCKMDLCLSCANEHKDHKVLLYEDKLIDMKKLRKKMDNLNSVINQVKKNLDEIINKLKKLKENLDEYYNINNNIINNYKNNKKRNYNILVNLSNIDKNIDSEIFKLQREFNYGFNLNKLIYLYTEINDENLEIEIKYKPNDHNQKLRLFGDIFINNNLYKCKIIYKNKEYDLTQFIDDIDKDYNLKDILTIKLKGYNNIRDMYCMFNECQSLFSLPDISKWNTSNIYNMGNIFRNCKSLSYLSDISKWDTSNVIDMGAMFAICSSLSSLPDISNWNTSKVTTMGFMFSWCGSLSSLPDISKWDTSNVNDMSYMFVCCGSLTSLPDISKWNTSNVNNFASMFEGCNPSLNIPSKFKN